MGLLYINACVRKESRTDLLAKYLISRSNQPVEEVFLNDANIYGLERVSLERRDDLIKAGEFSNPIFAHAEQFSKADIIVIGAPFWDLSFPAILKAYFENINVNGITFYYTEQGIPTSLCQARKLIYITTSGGYITNDEYGFGYVKEISNIFYGIQDICCFKAQGLDITGNNPEKILEETKTEIAKTMLSDKDFNFQLQI